MSKGFSLIEVMVALFIFSLGVLGVAKINLFALQKMDRAYLTNKAAIEASAIHKKQSGFLLLEIMAGLCISTLLVGSLLLVFMQTKASYRAILGLELIQNNGRFAFVFLKTALGTAEEVFSYSHEHRPLYFKNHVASGSDVLVLRHQAHKKAYFIADTHRVNTAGQSIYALYEKKYQAGRETLRRELLEGVDALFVRNGHIDLYLNSIEPIMAGLMPFIYTDTNSSFFGKDGRLHRKWSLPMVIKEEHPPAQNQSGMVLLLVLLLLLLFNLFAVAMLQKVSMEALLTLRFVKWLPH